MGALKEFLKYQTAITLILLFLMALFLRFMFFPGNIYFGYDQARDAFYSLGVLKGEFKIIGPTTSIPGFNHGALFYYLFAPIYWVFGSDPTGLSVFLRIYNAIGVFLVFFIGRYLFNKWTGITCALLFTFSYEQTQYALFMTHPALAVLSVLTFYLGLSLLLFKSKPYGLIISLLGLGLSFQFHFLLGFMFITFILNLVIFHKRIPNLNFKIISAAFFTLVLTLSTFIIAEAKYSFKTTWNLVNIFSNPEQTGTVFGGADNALLAANRYVYDNLLAVQGFAPFLLLVLFVASVYFLKERDARDKMIFLLIWFITGLTSYFINDTSLYFYGISSSVSLLIFVSFLVVKVYSKSLIVAELLIIAILSSNLYLIQKNNPSGPNPEINVQTGMFLQDEKRVIDYVYEKSEGEAFAVNAFSMPLKVNTTWSYLFEWYGQEKYGYLPVWGGVNTPGFEGNLIVNNSRSTLPDKRFLITEPIRGYGKGEIVDFMTEESWFTDIIEEVRFGGFIVDFQKPK